MDTVRLEKLGLKKAAGKINEFRETKRKIDIAYKNFRIIKPEKIEAFNKKLKDETLREDKNAYEYKVLAFTPLEDYEAVPPEAVLQKIEKAIEKDCFDSFEVAKIDWIKEIKDPIVFGRINGCPDRFYVAQWDTDIKVDDIFLEDIERAKK